MISLHNLHILNVKLKVKFTPEQATKAQKGSRSVYTYSLLNLDARCGWAAIATLRPFYPWERTCTHYIRRWVGHWDGLNGYGKYRTHWDSIP